MHELLAGAFVNGVLNMLGLPGIVGMTAAGLVGWKLLKDAKKPVLLLVLLGIGGCFALPFLLSLMSNKGGGHRGTTGHDDSIVWQNRQLPSVAPLPRWEPATKGKPAIVRTPAQVHAPAIKALHAARIEKVVKEQGAWPPPRAWREANLARALAKNEERKQREELLADKGRGLMSIPPAPPKPVVITPDMARSQAMDMRERWIERAQEDTRRMAAKYGL